MAKPKGLTQIGVQRLKEPGLHSDGLGLNLDVQKTGSKSWILRYMLNGRARYMGLGAYPEVSLAAAREKAAALRTVIKSGIDPLDGKHESKAKARAAAAKRITFADAAHQYIESHKASWKNAKHYSQWVNTLGTYAAPIIGKLDVAHIEVAHIVQILQKDNLWTTKTETATRLRGRLEKIFDACAVQGFRSKDNPARWNGNLQALLPAPAKVQKRSNQPALPYKQMPAFMSALKNTAGTSALALQFIILTASRSDETAGARWEEIDLAERVWTIPAERTKMKREHRVSLSDAAISVLKKMRPQDKGIIFHGREKNGEPQPLSNSSTNILIKRLHESQHKIDGTGWIDPKLNRIAVTHGFRSAFKDWASETTDYSNELSEMALAHKLPNAVEAAYRRGDLFEKRKALMKDWAKFCGVGK